MESTEDEVKILKHLMSGEILDLNPNGNISSAPTRASFYMWDEGHNLSAHSLRNALWKRGEDDVIPDPKGIRIRGARIIGRLDFENLETNIPLILEECYIPEGINAHSFRSPSLELLRCFIGNADKRGDECSLCLQDAHIKGALNLNGSTIINSHGPAFYGDQMRVESNLSFDSKFRCEGHGENGALRLLGARLGGQVSFEDATIVNAEGPALMADHVNIQGSLYLNSGFYVESQSSKGGVRLPGASVGGQLSLKEAEIFNNGGPAFQGDGLRVGRDVFFEGSFVTGGVGGSAAIRLVNAKVGGQLVFEKAHLVNSNGAALIATRLTVESNMYFDTGSTASGNGKDGVVHLVGAHVHGVLDLSDSIITNESGVGLDVTRMTVDGKVTLGEKFEIRSQRRCVAAIFKDAKFGSLQVTAASLEKANARRPWNVDGLRFEGFPISPMTLWVDFLRNGTSEYSAQPYQQIVSISRNAGHDNEVRSTSIRQQNDRIKRGKPGIRDKSWSIVKRCVIRYGYSYFLPIFWISVLLFAIWLLLGSWVPLWIQSNYANAGSGCSATERLQMAISLTLPLASADLDVLCPALHGIKIPDLLTIFSMFTKIMGWALVTIFIAGFTGIIRKN